MFNHIDDSLNDSDKNTSLTSQIDKFPDLNDNSLTNLRFRHTDQGKKRMITRRQLQAHPELDPALAKKIQLLRDKKSHKALTTTTSISVLKSFKTAILIPHWNEVMKEEIKALHDNQTWHLVP